MLDALFSLPLPPALPGAMPAGDAPAGAELAMAGAETAPNLFALLLEAQAPKAEALPNEAAPKLDEKIEPAAPAEPGMPPPVVDAALLAQLGLTPLPPRDAGSKAAAESVPPESGVAPTIAAPGPVSLAPEAAPGAPAAERPEPGRAEPLLQMDAPTHAPAHAPAGLAALGVPSAREPLSATATSPAAASLAAPVESPEFPAELAARVSMLARDGVQRAELRLHPVELGPVAVQIAIDGTQARVDFGAELFVTRHAIESSLPALAAALRDAGLTLSGGGVSQQMPGQAQRQDASAGDGHGARASGGHSGDDPAVSVVTPTVRRVRIGGVDLYA